MSAANLTVLPLLIPLLAAALCLTTWRSVQLQRLISIISAGALLISATLLLEQVRTHGILVLHVGNWTAPFGIALVADLLGAIMVTLAAIIAVAITLYSLGSLERAPQVFGYFPLMHLLIAGVCGAFLTGDIFNLYVWFEVMLIASFALLILGGERAQMEGAIKYVTLNLVSSAIFLAAIGLLYGITGTLNMADLSVKLAEHQDNPLVMVIAGLFLMAFGIKAGVFPLFFWLPASYHTPRIAVSSLFAALLTKVGVYALFRMFTLVFPLDSSALQPVVVFMAGATMLVGVLGAAAQFEIRRILSFHIISQIGYMVMALALYTPMALIGGIFYIIHHIIVKANLFLVAGLVFRMGGSYQLAELGGLYKRAPWLALLFLVPALALAGLPPLSGFFGKFVVIKAGVDVGSWALVAVALVVGLLTLYSMTKIWAEAFWKAAPDDGATTMQPNLAMIVPVVLLCALTVAIGINAEAVYQLSNAAATQLLDASGYVDAVLGGRP